MYKNQYSCLKRHKRRPPILATILTLTLLAGCQSQQVKQGLSSANVTSSNESVTNTTVTLENSYWQAIAISGRGIPEKGTTTLTFKTDGTLSGNAGCNLYRAGYTLTGNDLQLGPIATTKKLCSGPLVFHETRYLKLLQQVEKVDIVAEQLQLFSKESDQPIVFQKIPSEFAKLQMQR